MFEICGGAHRKSAADDEAEQESKKFCLHAKAVNDMLVSIMDDKIKNKGEWNDSGRELILFLSGKGFI